MYSPPSTPITLPVTKSKPSPLIDTIAAATSCGVVIRPVGLRRIEVSMIAWCSGIFISAGVTVTPARIAFTVIPVPRRASSIASWRVCDSSAAFAADTAPYEGTTRVEPSEVIENTREPCSSSPARSRSWTQ